MSVNGFTPLQIEDFGGLYTNVVTPTDAPILSSRRSGRGASIIPSALNAKNILFIPGGFLTRPGITTAFDFGGTRKATHLAQLITQQDQRQLLVVADDGGLYREPDAGSTLTALKTDWAPSTAIGHSATLFDREHLAVSDGRIGTGSPLTWDRTNLDRMSPSGPGKSHTTAAGAAGVNTTGLHKIVVIFETRNGYRTAPSLSVDFTVATNEKIVVSNIPTGPDWVISRILAMTTAGGASFFFTGDMVLDNNTATTLTIDVPDATLAAGTLVDRLFRRIVLPEQAGMLVYNDRMVTWGGRSRIQLPNLDFDGGFDPATSGLPAGWAQGASFAGAARETSDVYLGHAFKMTGDGAAANRGEITLTWTTDVAEANFTVGKKYLVRIRVKKTAGLVDGSVQIPFGPSTLTFGNVDISTTFTTLEKETAALTSLPTTITVKAAGTPTSGESFIVDSIQIRQSDSRFDSSVVRISDPLDPEAFDGVKGFLQVSPDDGQKVVTCFNFRNLLFIVKDRTLYVSKDDGVNPPALWEVPFVDKIGCDSLHGAAVAGEQFAVLSYRAGVYAIFGLRPEKVGQEIQQSPSGFPSWDDRQEAEAFKNHVIIDAEQKNIYLSIARSGGTWPNRTFILNYWKGWEESQRKWSYFDWNLPGFTAANVITSSLLAEESTGQQIFFGSEELNLYRHNGTKDDGNEIETIWRSAFLGFQEDGDNLFGAMSIHGLASGLPFNTPVIIEAYEIDETLRTISQSGGEAITADRYLELQMNLINEKLSFQLRTDVGDTDPILKVARMTIRGKPWYDTRSM